MLFLHRYFIKKFKITNYSRVSFKKIIKSLYSSQSKQIDSIDVPIENIRNFGIIAHVDHGKSTLADRLLEITGAIKQNTGKSQVLDKLQVERDRGITVKAQSVSLFYKYKEKEYLLNLIDTPGHVDFSAEVQRSLSICQGVILLVDANDGVQAQTVANFYLAFEKNLTIIPVLNKIDLKNANPDRACEQLKSLFDIEPSDVLKISAKLGIGIEAVLHSIIEKIPHPKADWNGPLKAFLFDGWYDRYRGALSLVYINSGEIQINDEIVSSYTQKSYQVKSLEILQPDERPVNKLIAGQVGLLGCNIRSSQEAIIGDTFYKKNCPVEALEGFKPPQSMVFAGIYPLDQSQHVSLRSAIEKLTLNDSAVTVTPDSSPALGQGWRLGFLGFLHLEVFCQRLEQEYGAQPVLTAPSVTYKIRLLPTKQNIKNNKQEIYISNPALFPEPYEIEECFEPIVLGTIITPSKYIGSIISLCIERRGVQKKSINIDNERIMLQFSLPLSEIILDFHDKLKSISSGYASFDYENTGFESSKLVKINILLNGSIVEELSTIAHASKANIIGKRICQRLKETIPRQLVQIAIQAAIGSRIIARETLKPYRKDVTAKLYGGDVTRRKKLLARQAAGKKKMKSIANITLPRDTFIEVLRR